jgi:caffeoyl-CoA O-methyltransferase
MQSEDNLLYKYISGHSSPEDDILVELTRETNLYVPYPRMLSGHIQGKLLEMISCMIKPEKILEIGTYTGYSAICLARGLAANGIMQTIEINDELNDISLRYFKKAGLADRISLINGNALELIPSLEGGYDIVFIDGSKHQYPQYYDMVFPKLNPGGFIIADNVFWDYKVLKPGPYRDKETRGITAFNDEVAADERVEKVILPLRDGLMIIKKKKS